MQKIAVLGAGPMGLAVAYQLVKDGHKPVIFEADDRVGGMTAAFDFGGLSIERYYHFHCTSDDAFFDVLKELGIKDKLHWVETKMGFYHKGKVSPWGNPVALLKFPEFLSTISTIKKFSNFFSLSGSDSFCAKIEVFLFQMLRSGVNGI